MPDGTPSSGSNVGLDLAHRLWRFINHLLTYLLTYVLYRPSNYNPPALLISMLITVAL